VKEGGEGNTVLKSRKRRMRRRIFRDE